MTLEVRRIRADEGLRLRAFRLFALADAPTAFGSTLAREEAFPERVWHERAARGASGEDQVTFVAQRQGHWIGLATGLAFDPDDLSRSRPTLVGPLSLGHLHQRAGDRALHSVWIPAHGRHQTGRAHALAHRVADGARLVLTRPPGPVDGPPVIHSGRSDCAVVLGADRAVP